MRLMQDKQPEYHVIDWRNSAFHNHDTSVKRKMLGGVSFDGGAISGGSKSGNNITQTGVHEAQPSFSHMYEEHAAINGGGSGLGNVKGEAVTRTATGNLNSKESKASNLDGSTGNNILNDIITGVTKNGRFSHMKSITFKLGRGIRTLLGRSAGDTGKQNRQKPKKKLTSGTRPVTKEDVYEIQLNSSYLLDSYNKNGERSTLGKQ